MMHILWDFDGTLFNTYPAYTRIFKTILGPDADEQEVYAKLKVSFSEAIRHYNLTDSQRQEMLRLETELSPELTPPFEGVEEVLKLAGLNVIMTHKPRKEAVAILHHYGWEKYFAEIVAGDDGFPRKPAPASYRYLHERHRIDLAIGDRELDILPAKALGIKTCLFQNSTPGADFYLEEYGQFSRIKDRLIVKG